VDNAGSQGGAELQQLEANSRNGGIGKLAVAQTDAAQYIDENIGHGRERHAQLIGPHGGRRGAISGSSPGTLQLALLADSVLGLAAGAVELLVERARIVAMRLRLREVTMKRGLAPSCVCSAAAFARAGLPITRRVRLQRSNCRSCSTGSRGTPAPAGPRRHIDASPRQADRQRCLQAAIARQAKHVVDAVRLAPSHQPVVAEAAVGAQDNAHARPFLAELCRRSGRPPRCSHNRTTLQISLRVGITDVSVRASRG
jgi:hypothetical protein